MTTHSTLTTLLTSSEWTDQVLASQQIKAYCIQAKKNLTTQEQYSEILSEIGEVFSIFFEQLKTLRSSLIKEVVEAFVAIVELVVRFDDDLVVKVIQGIFKPLVLTKNAFFEPCLKALERIMRVVEYRQMVLGLEVLFGDKHPTARKCAFLLAGVNVEEQWRGLEEEELEVFVDIIPAGIEDKDAEVREACGAFAKLLSEHFAVYVMDNIQWKINAKRWTRLVVNSGKKPETSSISRSMPARGRIRGSNRGRRRPPAFANSQKGGIEISVSGPSTSQDEPKPVVVAETENDANPEQETSEAKPELAQTKQETSEAKPEEAEQPELAEKPEETDPVEENTNEQIDDNTTPVHTDSTASRDVTPEASPIPETTFEEEFLEFDNFEIQGNFTETAELSIDIGTDLLNTSDLESLLEEQNFEVPSLNTAEFSEMLNADYSSPVEPKSEIETPSDFLNMDTNDFSALLMSTNEFSMIENEVPGTPEAYMAMDTMELSEMNFGDAPPPFNPEPSMNTENFAEMVSAFDPEPSMNTENFADMVSTFDPEPSMNTENFADMVSTFNPEPSKNTENFADMVSIQPPKKKVLYESDESEDDQSMLTTEMNTATFNMYLDSAVSDYNFTDDFDLNDFDVSNLSLLDTGESNGFSNLTQDFTNFMPENIEIADDLSENYYQMEDVIFGETKIHDETLSVHIDEDAITMNTYEIAIDPFDSLYQSLEDNPEFQKTEVTAEIDYDQVAKELSYDSESGEMEFTQVLTTNDENSFDDSFLSFDLDQIDLENIEPYDGNNSGTQIETPVIFSVEDKNSEQPTPDVFQVPEIVIKKPSIGSPMIEKRELEWKTLTFEDPEIKKAPQDQVLQGEKQSDNRMRLSLIHTEIDVQKNPVSLTDMRRRSNPLTQDTFPEPVSKVIKEDVKINTVPAEKRFSISTVYNEKDVPKIAPEPDTYRSPIREMPVAEPLKNAVDSSIRAHSAAEARMSISKYLAFEDSDSAEEIEVTCTPESVEFSETQVVPDSIEQVINVTKGAEAEDPSIPDIFETGEFKMPTRKPVATTESKAQRARREKAKRGAIETQKRLNERKSNSLKSQTNARNVVYIHTKKVVSGKENETPVFRPRNRGPPIETKKGETPMIKRTRSGTQDIQANKTRKNLFN